MREKQISIEGFSYQPEPDDKPSVGGFGKESTGKTRFGCTMPHEDGVIGLIAIDKKSKRTFSQMAQEMDVPYIARDKPYISDKEARDIVMWAEDDNVPGAGGVGGLSVADKEKAKRAIEAQQKKVKAFFKGLVDRVFEDAYRLAESPDVESIVIDTNSQLFQWILFKHFGRTTQIPPISRSAPNQDMIDFVNMLRAKNTYFIHRANEIWKNTGKLDKMGNPIKEPSGRFEPDGYKGIGAHLTVNLEFRNKVSLAGDVNEKFRVRVQTCQTNALLEGMELGEYGLVGEGITWDNLMAVIGYV